MNNLIDQLLALNIAKEDAETISHHVQLYLNENTKEQAWQHIVKRVLVKRYPFAVHQLLYQTVYPECDSVPTPAWLPEPEFIATTNLAKLMSELNFPEYRSLHHWSHTHYTEFWMKIIKKLHIQFDEMYYDIVDLSNGNEAPNWLPGAKLNIVNSCFTADKNAIAIIYQNEKNEKRQLTYGELEKLVNRIANSLKNRARIGDTIAIIMPMTIEAVAIYLGIIKAGCCVISIADSFAPDEIATRLRIANATAVFTQDFILRDNKKLPQYEKIIAANAPATVVIGIDDQTLIKRELDLRWQDFLSDDDECEAVSCHPYSHTNILFSSGTTGDPKAIPWTHTTPIKCGSDAYLHHNIKPNDILCWPTNLGWMMGPWLIYASLLNQATIALYDGLPNGFSFGKFVQDTKVTFLGVVPTSVSAWRNSACMETCDWSAIKLFSSTGECSNRDDMLYLMSLAGYKPVIEYCGGTEIGGAYITGTLIQPAAPAACTTPAMGLDFVILDEDYNIAEEGEVAIIPPSIGLSTSLLNKDHHHVYFEGMPQLENGTVLRHHGDQVERFANGFYRLLGRADDTMNLGGIKVSSAEIERALSTLETVKETAAIAVNPKGGGPSQLVIYAVLEDDQAISLPELKHNMQQLIRTHLNPLFKIHDVILVDALPRTASNKVMRRELRAKYTH